MPLLLRQNAIQESAGAKTNLAIGFSNLVDPQLQLGQLREAEANLRRQIELTRQLRDEFWEAVGHRSLGLLEGFQGRSHEGSSELEVALALFSKLDKKRSQTTEWVDRAFLFLEAILGRSRESPSEFLKLGTKNSQGVVWAYRAFSAVLLNNSKEALEAARQVAHRSRNAPDGGPHPVPEDQLGRI